MNAKIHKLIRQYGKAIGMNVAVVEKAFSHGDIHQKKRDLIAMRATLYAKKHIKPGMTYEKQQEIMAEFAKTENLQDVRFPRVKIKQDEKPITASQQDKVRDTDNKGSDAIPPAQVNEENSAGSSKQLRSEKNKDSKKL